MADFRFVKGNDVLYVIIDEKDDHRYEEQFPYSFLKVIVHNWNDDLSPWKADPVFGKMEFGGKATQFTEQLLAQLQKVEKEIHPSHTGICGYSLAGMYVLWLIGETDLFQKAASVSGSLWFPGLLAYLEEHPVHAQKVYLSLGEKEPQTRNAVMKNVGIYTQKAEEIISKHCQSVFEWNAGGHYADDFLRVSKGIRWLEKQ